MPSENFFQKTWWEQLYIVLGILALFFGLFFGFCQFFNSCSITPATIAFTSKIGDSTYIQEDSDSTKNTAPTNVPIKTQFTKKNITLSFIATIITCLIIIGLIKLVKVSIKRSEIKNYWAIRIDATSTIQKYLKTTKTERLFISAIGFGTLDSILSNSEVVENIAELMTKHNSRFEMIIVFPKNISEWKKYRPDFRGTQKEIIDNIKGGHDLIRNFITNITNYTDGMSMTERERKKYSINEHLKLYCYNNEIVPRHFILQGDDTIFIGSYLSHNRGSDSYLLQLKQDKSCFRYARLFDLFCNEADYILENSSEIQHEEFNEMS